MRLLYRDAQGAYHLKEIADALEESYAILSHRWYSDGDILYGDLSNQHQPETREKQGWRKLRYAVDQAERDGYRYVWIDTCCIDKTSSAELSEAINSMFFWYQQAQVCYAYLWDMSSECPPLSDAKAPGDEGEGNVTSDEDQDGQATDAASESDVLQQWRVTFTKCSWFTRGWTLQELIAPREVRFFGVDWNPLGSSHHLVKTIAARTLVDADLLRGRKELKRYSIAQRMSWAADRETSRIEDRAYSLLGLFDVNIPLLYGEREKSFMRLQEEIIRRSNDQSIFAWGYGMSVDENPGALLARSPTLFRGSSNIIFREPDSFGKALQLDNQALRGSFVVRYEMDGLWTAKLNCEDIKGRRIKLSIVRRNSISLHESSFQRRTLRSLEDRGIVAVARSGHGFCSRISPARAMPARTSGPVDAWRTVNKDKKSAGEIVKLRIVTSRANEDFFGGPLRLYVCPFKKHDRGSLEVLSVVPQGRILATTDLEHDPSLRPVITRFTYNDAAAFLIHVKNLNETLELTCTAELAGRRGRDGEYVCAGSLNVKKHTHKWQEYSWSHQAWQNYDLHPEHRFSGRAATFTLTLKDGWKFSTRMTVVGSTEPEVQLEFETLPPPTSRMGMIGGLKRLVDREDGKVQFEAA
ncbi:hypothetical protein D0869_15690 [Hortaea werneckii]|uniref:Uncharacterized protein n=1 Tax=Hortaea werneckii TaxID=91943 RepID=A0A3M7B2S4_HORWE|nr:hypothetical protein KC334_g10613 [Hortaea werneckii]KAI6989958.1 hypothetical protein KC355_g10440 [Hortaea werneckii]KAI7199570.1 hypothetical protein KC324_g3196 [Hortaea werneckii]KAI7577807.1 hypothetical protein KC316_g10142 [Hortaea werneckii]KAI7657271.1 hypothetical protein KC318_g11897 [Hortaea werneckii]